jgi:polysaccharide biosynthesis protein PelA
MSSERSMIPETKRWAWWTSTRGFPGILAAVLSMTTGISPSLASGAEAASAPALRRDVVALYDSEREGEPRSTRLHRFVELPLNHLGYRVTYWDIVRGMPDPQLTERAAAVISWFDEPVANRDFARWCADLAGVEPRSLRIVFGDPGLRLDGAPDAGRDACLARSGLRLASSPVRVGMFAKIAAADKSMFPQPSDLLPPAGIYPALAAAEDATSRLAIAAAGDGTPVLDFAVTAPGGGYVHAAAALATDSRLPDPIWRIDVFAFLQAVLTEPLQPVPDVTTQLGRRLFFATVGPDGWLWHLPAVRYSETPVLASQALVPLLSGEYPDVPVTAAVVAGDLDPATGGRDAEAGRGAAAALFALPQVEVASAGISGIRDWSFFARFDPAREGAALAAARRSGPRDAPGFVSSAIRSLGMTFATGNVEFALPRRYMAQPFSVDAEIGGGLAASAQLALAERRPSLFFWAGNGTPFEEALAASPVPSIGGGGGLVRTTASAPSGLWPFSVQVAGRRQVYNALSGPEAYDGPGDAPDWAFQELATTLAATEMPRRLKPFQLSFSAGDMARFGPRQAVRRFLALAHESQVLPVRASDYAEIVEGFATAEVVPLAPLSWRIDNRGALGTVRFDHAADVSLDLDESVGVLGAARKGDTLYVALDPAVLSSVLALTESSAPSAMTTGSGRLGIADSRWSISALVQDSCSSRFDAKGFGPGDIRIATNPGRQFEVRAIWRDDPGRPAFEATRVADTSGTLSLDFPPLRGGTAEILLSDHCDS